MEYNNNKFFGEINGKKVNDYIKDLDYSIDNVADRIEYVKQRLGITEKDGIQFPNDFWESVFTQTTDSAYEPDSVHYVEELDRFLNIPQLRRWCEKNNISVNEYLGVKDRFKEKGGGSWNYTHKDTSNIKLILNKDDSLYSTSNIAANLESLGNYILGLDLEGKEEKKVKLKVYKNQKDFERAINKEKKYIRLYGEQIDSDEGKELKVLKLEKNYKLAPEKTVTKEDINKYPVLKNYNAYLTYLRDVLDSEEKQDELIAKLKEKGNCRYDNRSKLQGYLRRQIGEVKKDMLKVKDELERPIVFKQALKDEGYPSWDEFDELDKAHVKALLQVHRDMGVVDFQSDLMCMLYDLQKVLKEVKLTDNQKEILNLWINGCIADNIADKLKKNKSTISRSIDTIVNKIVSIYEEKMEDWYYLNICKGIYKKCSQCGEIKLINKFNKNGKRGYKSMCRVCENKRKIK